MNARSTNRPGGRGRRRPNVRSSSGGDSGGKSFLREVAGCAVLALALAALPAAVLADVIWGLVTR